MERTILAGPARLLVVAALLAALGPAPRADVLHVPTDHASIQAAIDAAQPGDVVLVAPGSYAEKVQILGKGLSLLADGGEVEAHDLEVRLVPAGELVVVAGIIFRAQGFAPVESGLVARSNDGALRFSDCTFFGENGWTSYIPSGSFGRNGQPGARVTNCASVSFSGCTFVGGRGGSLIDEKTDGQPTHGGDGLGVSNSEVVVFGGVIAAGGGGSAQDTVILPGADGGHGVLVQEGARTELHGVDVRGGHGGGPDCEVFPGSCGNGGDGGDAVRLLDAGTLAVLRDNLLTVGPAGGSIGHGSPGSPGIELRTEPGTTATSYPSPHRGLALNTPVREGESLDFVVTGEPGDAAFVFVSLGAAHVPLPAYEGSFLLGFPLVLQNVGLGAVPVAGELALSIPLPDLGPGIDAVPAHVQLVVDDGGQLLLGPARLSWLLDAGV